MSNQFKALADLLNHQVKTSGRVHRVEGNCYLVSTPNGSLMCRLSGNQEVKSGDTVNIEDGVIRETVVSSTKAKTYTV